MAVMVALVVLMQVLVVVLLVRLPDDRAEAARDNHGAAFSEDEEQFLGTCEPNFPTVDR